MRGLIYFQKSRGWFFLDFLFFLNFFCFFWNEFWLFLKLLTFGLSENPLSSDEEVHDEEEVEEEVLSLLVVWYAGNCSRSLHTTLLEIFSLFWKLLDFWLFWLSRLFWLFPLAVVVVFIPLITCPWFFFCDSFFAAAPFIIFVTRWKSLIFPNALLCKNPTITITTEITKQKTFSIKWNQNPSATLS